MTDYLLDTNILLRFAQRNHPLHLLVRTTIWQMRQDGHQLKVATQNGIEFWNVATRPQDRNGFGLTSLQADRLLLRIERLFFILPDRLLFT